MFKYIRRAIMKLILKSAFAFENDSTDLYRKLKEETAGTEAEREFEKLMREEERHRILLDKIVKCPITDCDLDQNLENLSDFKLHDISRIKPIPEELKERVGKEIEEALREEEKTVIFYANLSKISKLKAAKEAFNILADMEARHLLILKKLLSP